jgi:replication-associated recombination protein RarA
MIPLTEKHKPVTLDSFAGLNRPKAILSRFASDPGPSAWLFLGPSGTGKTTMALALAELIGGELHHVPSKTCDLKTVNEVVEKCHYYPWSGKWHFVLVDEADQMSRAAQLALLSKLDSTAAPPNTIFFFTANDTELLEDRFLSRCRTLRFDKPESAEIESFLSHVWESESSDPTPDMAQLRYEANGNLRSALMLLEMELIAPTPRKSQPAPKPVVAENAPEPPPTPPAPSARKLSWGEQLWANGQKARA